MTKDAPAFDFFPERFWLAVEGWTDREIVQFMRLLSQQWLRDGLEPGDMAGLARGKLSPRVAAKFPVASDGVMRNPRLEVVRSEQRERIASRRVGALVTNAKRYGLDSLSADEVAILEVAGWVANGSLSDKKKARSAIAQRLASDAVSESLTPRHHPPPTTHPLERERENAGAPELGVYPDPREYPSVAEVCQWAEQAMIPRAVAEDWHAMRTADGWLNARGNGPLSTDKAALRAYFLPWARKASVPRATYSKPSAPRRTDDLNDV